MLPSVPTRVTSSPRAWRCFTGHCSVVVDVCFRCRVAVGEYNPNVAGSASSNAQLVAAASARLGALVADLRQVGASCGLGGAHEAAHVANARVRGAEGAHVRAGTPSALVGTKLSVVRQAAVDAIAEAKCDSTHTCLLLALRPDRAVAVGSADHARVCRCLLYVASRQALAVATSK